MEYENNFRDFPKEIKNTSEKTNPLTDIISSIQEKLDNKNSFQNVSKSNNLNNTYNTNITSEYKNSEKQNSSFDISSILKTLTNLGISNSTNAYTPPQSTNETTGLNLDTIMRFSKLLNGFNKDDPRKNLLNSLKPFMGDTRKKNVDTYVFVLGILNVLDNLGKEDSGNNDM